MSSPGRVTWGVAVVGLAVQAVTLVVATVLLAHTAATIGDQDPNASFAALFDTLLGPFLYTVAAITVGAFALLLVVATLLCTWAGARFTGLVIALAAQVPVVGWPVYAVVGGEDVSPLLLAVFVGAALLILGALFPGTWRWSRRPQQAPHAADTTAVAPG